MAVSMECGEAVAECGYLGEELEVGVMGDGKAVSRMCKKEAEEGLEESIFVPNEARNRKLTAFKLVIRKSEEEKTFRSVGKVFGKSSVEVRGEIGASFSFGGGEDPQFNINFNGSVGDQKGNSGNIQVNVDEKGRTTVSTYASHEDSKNRI